MTAALDFSDAVFATVEARRFDAPLQAAPDAADIISIPEAARLLGEARQTTWARPGDQLERITVGKKTFVRRSQVLDLKATLDARRAPVALPKQVGEWDHARSVATSRARSSTEAAAEQLGELAREIHAMREEVRALRRVLIVKGVP